MMRKIGFMRQVVNEKREGRSRVSLIGLSFCSLNLARCYGLSLRGKPLRRWPLGVSAGVALPLR